MTIYFSNFCHDNYDQLLKKLKNKLIERLLYSDNLK